MPRARRPTLQTEEVLLDNAVELTFPASDPVAVDHAYESARRQRRERESEAKRTSPGANRERSRKPPRRS